MKINEKHLLSFANSHSPTDKKGFLHKRGEVNKAFQKRWFILKGNLLFYYEKKDDKDPIGVVILEGCTVELSEMNDTNTFTFELVFQGSGSRTYILAADTQEEMESWMKAITCANYDYMKLMVAELQRQLDEINSEPSFELKDAARHSSQNLVDLSVPDLSEPTGSGAIQDQSSQRRNPFGFVNSAGSGLDAFGATPFQPGLGSSISGTKGRTFKEMHDDFGKYIIEKMASYNDGSPLVDILGSSSA